MPDVSLSVLRDRLQSNTIATRRLATMLEIQNLLQELKLGLITKDDLINNPVYTEYKKSQNKK